MTCSSLSNNSAELIDSLVSDQETWTEVTLDVLDFVITGGWKCSVATGIQLREESIDIDRSANSLVVLDANGRFGYTSKHDFLRWWYS